MNIRYRYYPRLFLVAFILQIAGCGAPKSHDLIISNVNLIDVRTGAVSPNQSVAIDADTISMIYQGKVETADSARIINGTGKYLIPGLWDMHVHHQRSYQKTNPLLLANGVTGIREMWGNMEIHRMLQRAIATDSLDVPDIYTASVIIDGKPEIWPGSIGVGNAEEARKAALEQIESGVDFLKVYSLLSKEAFDAIAEVANEKGVPFAGHVPDVISIQHAAKMGMVSAEHLFGVLLGSSSKKDSLLEAGVGEYQNIDLMVDTFSQAQFDSLCSVLVEEELWMSPTLITNKGAAYFGDPDYTSDERLAYMPSEMIQWWIWDSVALHSPSSQERIRQEQKSFHFLLPLVGQMHSRGVRFLAGSDYPNPYCFPGFSLHDELAIMVEGGMSNLAALQTATLNPAIFMKKEDQFGSIEPGKTASLVLLAKNPLDTIENTKTIEAVILRGKPFEKEALEEMLETVRKDIQKPRYSAWIKKSIKRNGLELTMDSLDLLISSESSTYLLEEADINALGYELARSGDFKSAVKILEKNTLLFPESYNTYDSYAEALLYTQQFEKAKENYQKASALNPNYTNGKVMIDSINSMLQ
ncbi:MAG: amidohydrolase family protein [Bacteroidota bacterium]